MTENAHAVHCIKAARLEGHNVQRRLYERHSCPSAEHGMARLFKHVSGDVDADDNHVIVKAVKVAAGTAP